MNGLFVLRPTMDHFWGKARGESVESCWAIADGCHYLKTNNNPTRGYWLEKFAAHCDRYGYSREAEKARRELESEALVREAAAVGVRR